MNQFQGDVEISSPSFDDKFSQASVNQKSLHSDDFWLNYSLSKKCGVFFAPRCIFNDVFKRVLHACMRE